MRSLFRKSILLAGALGLAAPFSALAAPAGEGGEGATPAARQSFGAGMELDESKRTAAAEQKRDESIEQLKNIIRRFEAGPQRSELLFQLAELWIEKSKYVYFQEFAEYDRHYQEYIECTDSKGFDACGEAPQVETRQSSLFLDEALRLYEQILKDSPLYPRKDEVLFSLAMNLYQKGQRDKALGHYRDLVTQYPQSRFAGDAYVAMGDHYFNANELTRAEAAFAKALDSSMNEPRVYNYALYKLAWCDFNGGNYEGSLQKLQQVVDRSEMGRTRNEVGLKDEALRDMVRTWEKLEGVEEANDYYKRKTNKAGARRWFSALANRYFSEGLHDLAIRSFRILIDEDPNDPRSPEFQSSIVRAFEGLRRRDKVVDEMKVLVANYKPGSSWAVANQDNQSALASAYDLTEGAMRELVTDYHQEAQKTKEVKTYRLAAQIYKDYLDSFSDSDYAYNLRYYYAEILWTLEEWELAAEQYELVYAADPAGSYATTAAYNTLLTYEKLIAIEKGELERSALRDEQKVDENKAKGAAQKSKKVTTAKIDKDVQAEEIPQWEAKMIEACDRYAVIAANDPRLQRGQDEIQVRYKAAFIFYDRKHFTEAAKRFGDIILKWPDDNQARIAADLSLDILEIKEEWFELARLSRAFYENKRLARPGQKWTQDLARIMEGAQYKYIDLVVYQQEKRNEDAAGMFRDFVTEFPKSEFAARALLYAMTIYREANKLDLGVQVGEQMLAEYPTSEFRSQAVIWLGGFYRESANFGRAAAYFEQYAREWEEKVGIRPDPKADPKGRIALKKPEDVIKANPEDALKASDALYEAALWTEGVGDFEKAIALYREFIEKYSTVPKGVPASALALNIGLIYEKTREWDKAEKAFDDFIKGYERKVNAGQIFWARYRRALALVELKQATDANRAFEAVAKEFSSLPASDRSRIDYLDAYAHARFTMMESNWRQYVSIKFDNERTLKNRLQAKVKATPTLEQGYTEVLSIGSADWGIAALTRIGMMYQDFARNFVDSPDPANLDDDQLVMYRTELEDRAFPLEEKAIEAYEMALQKSYELSVYNDFTLYAQNALNRFKPGEYGEIRTVGTTGSEFFSRAPFAASLSAGFDAGLEAKAPEAGQQAAAEEDGAAEGVEASDSDEKEIEAPAPKKGVLIMDKAAAN